MTFESLDAEADIFLNGCHLGHHKSAFYPFSTEDVKVTLEVYYQDEKVAGIEQEEFLRSGLNFIKAVLMIENAMLWWLNGMGGQPQYAIHVRVKSGEAISCYVPSQMGIRTLTLNQEKEDAGRRFILEVNGRKVFAKGGNWIPADSIYARIPDAKFHTLLKEAKEADFNMLRVRGGGIYERDIFYNQCDEYGILLWHDFMFACAIYPDDLSWFRMEVENEMDYQTRRLRNHPSLALWCGNNENHWLSFDVKEEERRPDFLGGAICYNQIAPRIEAYSERNRWHHKSHGYQRNIQSYQL